MVYAHYYLLIITLPFRIIKFDKFVKAEVESSINSSSKIQSVGVINAVKLGFSSFLQKFFQGQNLLLCKRLLFSDQNFRRRVRMTAKVIPTQKWSPRCDGLVDWLYAVQDLMCYYIMHCNDKIQVSVENCSKCLASLTLQQFIH